MDENKIIVARSLSVDKHSVRLATLINALFYDLVQDKQVQIPKQGERRERELQELVKKGKRPVALFVDEAHNLNGNTVTGLKRLMEVVVDVCSESEISYNLARIIYRKAKSAIWRNVRIPKIYV